MCKFYFYPIGSQWMVHVERPNNESEKFGGFQNEEEAIQQAREDCAGFGCSPAFTPIILSSETELKMALASSSGQLSPAQKKQIKRESALQLASLFTDLSDQIDTQDETLILSEIERQLRSFKAI
ncbi:MAG: hypothetical protein ACYC9L_03180 [Sulfuricaulis sp.]